MTGNLARKQSKTKEPLHIVSAFSKADGVCLGQVPTDKKSNDINAIPKMIDHLLHLKGQVVIIDAMGTQTDIVKKLYKKKPVLAGSSFNRYGGDRGRIRRKDHHKKALLHHEL